MALLACEGESPQDAPEADAEAAEAGVDAGADATADLRRLPDAGPLRLWPRSPPATPGLPPSLSDFEWLEDVLATSHTVDPESRRPERGSYGVGNGLVFGLIGLDRPANTITGMSGPIYQRPDGGFFGDFAVQSPADSEAVFALRDAPVVRTLRSWGELSLETLDFAPPGRPQIIRHLVLRNRGPDAELDLELALAGVEGLAQTRGERSLTITCPELPERIEAEAVLELTCTLDFGPSDAAPLPQLLEETRTAYQAWRGQAARLVVPDPAVNDLYEGLLQTLYVQTDRSGVVSPMNRYTKGWLRDAEGPVLMLLRAGHFEAAQAALDGVHRALLHRGAISNSFDLRAASEEPEAPADPAAFWAAVDFMPNRNPAEAPSYLPILYRALHAHAGEALAPDLLELLRASVERQVVHEGLLDFSGDETYRFVMTPALGIGAPEVCCWSAQSAFLYVVAAEATAHLLGDESLLAAAEAVRAVTDARYQVEDPELGRFYAPVLRKEDGLPFPRPFEDVAMSPLWTGYLGPDAAAEHLQASLDYLLREDTSLLSPKTGASPTPVLAYTGMVPGLLLSNLARAQHTKMHVAFDALATTATPSGHFEELQDGAHRPLDLTHAADGTGGDTTARYRPWESGIVGAALLDYLVGAEPEAAEQRLSLRPHLPPSWPSLRVEHLRVGAQRYTLELRRTPTGLALEVSGLPEGWQVDVELAAEHPFAGEAAKGQGEPAPYLWRRSVPSEATLLLEAPYAL